LVGHRSIVDGGYENPTVYVWEATKWINEKEKSEEKEIRRKKDEEKC